MRLGVPYKVVGGTRFYDRREVKDAMAYLRAVVNPADEVSVKRVLNVPKRGVGDASIAKLDALAAAEGIGFLDALRRADEAGVTGPAVRGIESFVALARRARRAGAATATRRPRSGRGPGDVLQAALDGSGYLAELEAEDTVESAGPAGEPRRARRFGSRVHARRRVPRTGLARRRHRRAHASDDQVVLMTLHSAKGLEFPVVFLVGAEDGIFPTRPRARTARRAGGGTAPRLRRDHAGERAALRHARLEPQPVRLDAVQPAVTVHRGDPRRARRVAGQHLGPHRLRPPEPAAARGLGIAAARIAAAAATDATSTTGGATDAHRERVVEAAMAAGQRASAAGGSVHLGLNIGDDVEHPAFGEGVIIDLRRAGRDGRGDRQLPRRRHEAPRPRPSRPSASANSGLATLNRTRPGRCAPRAPIAVRLAGARPRPAGLASLSRRSRATRSGGRSPPL